MASQPQSILPGFAAPPLDESVLAVQFEPNTVDSFAAAAFYERIREEYPNREEQMARPPMGEDFSPVEPRPPVQIEVIRPPSMPRHWFISSDETFLIQLQHDFFAFNWRRKPEGTAYPRFEAMRRSIENHLRALEAVLLEREGRPIRPNWCEVTYINHVEPAGDELDRLPLNVLLAGVEIPAKGSRLPAIDDGQITLRLVIPDDEGNPRGRLNITAIAAIRNIDRVPIWALTFTARLLAEGDRGIDGALQTFDVGHEWVATAFKELTSEQMQARWHTSEGD